MYKNLRVVVNNERKRYKTSNIDTTSSLDSVGDERESRLGSTTSLVGQTRRDSVGNAEQVETRL